MPRHGNLGNWSAGRPRAILLATDMSARSDRPLDRAVQLARQWDAQLVALHVVERMPPGKGKDAVLAQLKPAMFDGMPARDRGFRVEVKFGAVGDRILETAAEVGADLIVTGVARCNELGDYVLGTSVERLVRSSPAPVLVVKRRVSAEYRKLLAPTDYSDAAASALEVLPAFPRAAATLMHAYHVPFEGFVAREANEAEVRADDRAECERFVGALPPAIRERLQIVNDYGPVDQVLTRRVNDHGYELAVIGSRSRSGLGRALIGSTAEALLGALPCDVLVVPMPGEGMRRVL